MTTLKNLMGTGIPAQSASVIATGQLSNGLSAAGTTQATATKVLTDFAVFTTVASGAGAIMPANCNPGDWYTIINHGANPLLLYPPVGGTIKNGATNAAASIPSNAVAQVLCITPLQFACATSS